MLQTLSILSVNRMIELGVNPGFASKLIQHGWETITESLKHGGITNMMDRLSNPSKLKAYELSEELKSILSPLFVTHMSNIFTSNFYESMMKEWNNEDKEILHSRDTTSQIAIEQTSHTSDEINEEANSVRVSSPIRSYRDNRYGFFALKTRSHGYIIDGTRSWVNYWMAILYIT